MYHSVKTKRTLFTEEKIANLRKNIEKFDWAKEKAAEILKKADFYLGLGTDRIAFDMANETLKRSGSVNEKCGCPNCGREMMRYGWLIDVEAHPWKIKCPSCGRLYPSNDFEAFYRSGQDEHGDFSYDRADRSLLVNTLYPDEAPDYAVDDGSGWLKDPSNPGNGGRYSFIPHYVFMSMWMFNCGMKSNYVKNAIQSMSMAYLLTDDRKYSDPAAMLLAKMAYLYPRMDTLESPWHLGYTQSHGLTGKGRFIGCIWDAILVNEIVEWYDILYPCMDDALAAYIRENPVRYFGEAPQCGADVLDGIDENLMLHVYPDLKAAILNCNPGPPHAMLLKTAIALQRDDLFDEYAAHVYSNPAPKEAGRHWQDLETLVNCRVTREGFAGEVAPGYNSMWADGFMEAAPYLKGSKYDPFKNVKFVKLGNMVREYAVCDGNTLNIGDSKVCGNPGLVIDKNAQVQYFLATGNVRDAALLVKAAGDDPICTDWYLDCEAVDRQVRDAAASAGAFRSESRCLPQFGLAVVESHPEGKAPEANAVWFGQNHGHSHRDTMNLFLHGFGIDLMPDHGYPDFANANFPRFRWTSNMISHNTAMIPQEKPFTDAELEGNTPCYRSNIGIQDGGKLRSFLAGDKVSLIDAEAPKIYGDLFRRTVVTVDLDGKSRYLVDLFDVGGKGAQRLSYHAIGTETTVTGADFIPQDGGTYAGADVPYQDDAYSTHWCDGFNYLKDVKRAATPAAGFTVDWTCVDNWHVWERERDVHVKLHTLSAVEEAALCMGQPPQTKKENPREMAYLILKNGEGQAHFVNVLEPYEDASFIEACTYSTDGDTVTVTVTHKSGRVDTITVARTGKNCRLTVESTTGYTMSYGDTVLTAEVVDFTRELGFANAVTVRLSSDTDAAALKGKYIDIETDVEPNAFYEIVGAESLGDGLWKLDVGDCTFVAGYVDRMEKDKGYRYFIEPGAKARIAM